MPFIDQLDAEADPAAKTRLFLGALHADRRGLFADLRAKRPILDLPPFLVLSRWADVIDTLARCDAFAVTGRPHRDPSVGRFMLGRDEGEDNWRNTSIMRTLLRWEDLPGIRAVAGKTAAATLAAGEGSVEIVSAVPRLVPLRVVQQCFGFAGPDDATTLAWSEASQPGMLHNLFNDPAVLDAHIAAGEAMRAWVRGFLAGREPWASAAGNDTVSRLLRAMAHGVSGLEGAGVVTNVCGQLVGAIATSSRAIVHATGQILQRPVQLARAVQAAQDNDVATLDAIVWEALRFNPATNFVLRVATQETVLAPGSDHEARVAPGRVVAVGIGSAMFDGGVFPDPEMFKMRPRSLYLHLGHGSHTFLSQYVAHAIIPETIRQILLLPGLRLLPGGLSGANATSGRFAGAFTVGTGLELAHA